jgi:hypothetical protein
VHQHVGVQHEDLFLHGLGHRWEKRSEPSRGIGQAAKGAGSV